MRRLAIVDHMVSAGGVERFLHGLVGGLLEIPEFRDWEVSLVFARRNSAGASVEWPPELNAPNLQVLYMQDGLIDRAFQMLDRPSRIAGIYGTSVIRQAIPRILRSHGPVWVRSLAGDRRSWLERFFRHNRFDLVYFSYPYEMECPRLRAPLVMTTHDFNFWRFKDVGPRAFARASRQMPTWLDRCSRLVVSSDFIRSELSTFYPGSERKARIVRLGIPGQAGPVAATNPPGSAHLADLPEQFFLTVGWIAPHKNQLLLVDAMKQLIDEGLHMPVVFVGPSSDHLQPGNQKLASDYARAVYARCVEAGLVHGRDYWAPGYVDDAELESLYRRASALVMPTLYEAGSFPVREAMRAGCPVICSNIPALVEEVGLVGGNAWLFDPHDSADLVNTIKLVLDNPIKVRQRADAAAQIVTQVFSWEATAEGYLSVFEEAMG